MVKNEKRIDTLEFEKANEYSQKMMLRDSLKIFTDFNWYRQAGVDTLCPFCGFILGSADIVVHNQWRKNYLDLWGRAVKKCPEILTKPKMNWQKIEDSCPKGFEELLKFIDDNAKDLATQNFKEVLLQDYVRWQSLWGWIETFFISKKIIIKLKIIGSLELNPFKWHWIIIYGSNAIVTDSKRYEDYQEAQESAAIRAFEILEKQLKDKK
jgi:hypothetical protein